MLSMLFFLIFRYHFHHSPSISLYVHAHTHAQHHRACYNAKFLDDLRNHRKGTWILLYVNSYAHHSNSLIFSYLSAPKDRPVNFPNVFPTRIPLPASKIKCFHVKQLPFSFFQEFNLVIEAIYLGYCTYKIVFPNMTRSFFLNQHSSLFQRSLGYILSWVKQKTLLRLQGLYTHVEPWSRKKGGTNEWF